MLPINLTTNEVKDSAGVEVEFNRQSSVDRTVTFAKVGEVPNREHRLKVSHQENGSGKAMVRRSLTRIDKTVTGDDGNPVVISAYEVLVIPIGNLGGFTEVKHVQAELMSFLASTGVDTAIKFDCTGYGAEALVNGSL